jgi:hypothetical protein
VGRFAEALEKLADKILEEDAMNEKRKAIHEIAAVVISDGVDSRAMIERYSDCPVGTHLYKQPSDALSYRGWRAANPDEEALYITEDGCRWIYDE